MAADASVQVEIVAALSDFKSQMASAAVAMNQAARKMGVDLDAIGESSKKTSKHVGGLSDALKEHRREMRAEAGMSKVLARDLANLGLDAKGAGGEIAHLIAAFAIGGGMGAAIAGLKLIAHHFKELGAEEEKAKEVLTKWFDEMDKRHARAVEEIQTMSDKLLGLRPEQIYAREQQSVLAQAAVLQAKVSAEQREQERLSEKILADKKATADAIARGSSLRMEDVGVVDAASIQRSQARVKDLQDQITALNREAADWSQKASLSVSQGAKDWNTKSAEDAKRRREADAAQREKEAFENAQNLSRQLQHEQGQNEHYWSQSAQLRAHWAKVGATEEEKVALEMQEAMAKLREDDVVARETVWEGYLRRLKELSEKHKADLSQDEKWMEKWSNDIGKMFGHQFARMIMDAKSFADVVAEVFKMLAEAVIAEIARMAAAWLALTALKGIAGLFTGGAAVAGYSAADLTAEEGLGELAYAGGRAAGGPVAANVPYRVGENGPELFVPSAAGTIVPNFALAGGGGISLTVNAIDARSFDGYLRSGGDSVLIRALDRARAQGRFR